MLEADCIEDVLPSSDVLYKRHDRRNSSAPIEQRYYSSVQIRRGRNKNLIQSIQIGDLIAVRKEGEVRQGRSSFAFSKREPFSDTEWAVAQVLTLYSSLPVVPTMKSKQHQTFHAHVKWFIPFKSRATQMFLQKQDVDELRNKFRPEFHLLEQQTITEIISLSHDVLPGHIVLKPPKEFRDITHSEEVATGCYEIPFFCKRRLEFSKPTTDCNHEEILCFPSVSASVIRGWDSWERQDPELFKSDHGVDGTTTFRDSMVLSFNIQTPRFAEITLDVKPSKSGVHDDESKATASEESSATKTATTIDSSRSNSSISATMSSSSPIHIGKSKKMKGKPLLKKILPVKKCTKHKPQQQRVEKKNATDGKKSKDQIAAKNDKKNNEKKRSANDDNITILSKRAKKSKDVNKMKTGTQTDKIKQKLKSSELLASEPMGKILYRYEIPTSEINNTPTRGKKQKPLSETLDQTYLDFYSAVSIKTNWDGVSLKGHGLNRNVKRWIISIGDVIAMACDNAISSQPIYTPNKSSNKLVRKDQWFPFNRKWSPAQVVAVYRKTSKDSNLGDDTDNVYVQLRWLYRPDELLVTKGVKVTKKHLQQVFLSTVKHPISSCCNESNPSGKNRNNPLLSGRNFIETDHTDDETFASGALGRIVTKGDEVDDDDELMLWLNKFAGKDGIPQVPIICRASFFRFSNSTTALTGKSNTLELLPATDWSRYGSTIQRGPLNRLLICSHGYPGKIQDLRERSKSILNDESIPPAEKPYLGNDTSVNKLPAEKPYVGNDTSVNELLLSPSSYSSLSASSWPQELLSWQDTKLKQDECNPSRFVHADILHRKSMSDGIQRIFMQSIPTQLVSRRFRNPRATGKKTEVTEWTLQVGDVVCIATNGKKQDNAKTIFLNTQSKSKKRISPWDPFIGPWRVCQILSIYHDQSNNTTCSVKSPTYYVEVRWFHRKSDLPSHVLPWMPPSHDTALVGEEVFETDCVEDDIPLSHVLGCVDLFLGHHTKVSNVRHKDATDVPSPSCRCRYFYFSHYERFQPLFCSATESKDWYRLLFERGLRLSSLINEDKSLSQVIETFFEVNLRKNARGIDQLFYGLSSAQEYKVEEQASCKQPLELPNDELKNDFEYYQSTDVVPLWSEFEKAEIVCAKDSRKGLKWTVRVGDIVAVKTRSSDSDDAHSEHAYFPFRSPWRPAQVLALFSKKKSDSKVLPQLQMQVRWLYRKIEPRNLQFLIGEGGLDSVYEMDQVSLDPLEVNTLLGPIALVDQENKQYCDRMWQTFPPYLPICLFFFGGSYDTTHGCRVQGTSLHDLVHRGIELSDHYGSKSRLLLLDAVKRDCEDSPQISTFCQLSMQMFLKNLETSASLPETLRDQKAKKKSHTQRLIKTWTSVPSFHIDKSTGCEYFHEVDVKPPYEEYVLAKPTCLQDQSPIWAVRLGDMVAVRYNYAINGIDGMTRAAYGIRSLEYPRGGRFWPFKTQWAIGEVVSIMKRRKTFDDDVHRNLQSDLEKENPLKIEIRWFYRPSDLSGMTQSFLPVSDLKSEEIFESDHYDEIDSSDLLGPVDLHERPVLVTDPKHRIGMPVIDFFCNRFYSIHHKSLIPATGLSGRISRGHSKSPRIGKDAALKSSIERIFVSNPLSQPKASNIVANKSQASTLWENSFQQVIMKLSLTDASKEAFKETSALVGRTKERKQIITFLRSSIRGDTSDKPSIFVAGPPGVGKTASIRAAICELKHEQSAGIIPEFDFVALNGMEMRHPFEAYIKLWKEMNKGNDAALPAERAASNLEAYFSGKKAVTESEKNRVVVVLLDEIDYLVTNKQTVLYNFFDWPMRSLEAKSRARIVVIGVSNTLNLPERLHPRVQSRIGSKRIFFKSYNVDETVSILKAKIEQASPHYAVFDEDSILFAAKKIAALSGDIRKAFQICRTAADMVMNETLTSKTGGTPSDPIVRIKDVLKVSRESSNTAHSRAIALCTPYEVLLIISLASLAKSTGREYGSFDVEEILVKMEAIANSTGNPLYQPAPDLTETLAIISRLREEDLVSLETPLNSSVSYRASLGGIGGPWPLVSMIIDDHAVLHALKKTQHHELARKYLVNSFQ